MAEKMVAVRYCDRCGKRRATKVVRYTYRGRNYEVDVCDTHYGVLDKTMAAWTAVSREVTAPILPMRPAVASQAPAPPVQTATVEPAISVPVLRAIAADRQAREALDAEAKAAEPPVELPGVIDLRPTRNIEAQLSAWGIRWDAVVDAVRHAKQIYPDRLPGVSIYQNEGLSVRVSDDKAALSLLVRDAERPARQRPAERPANKPTRKGKRGGIGSRGPKDYESVLEAVRTAPGWVLVLGGKHYQARGPKGQLVSLSITPSDHRSVDNAIAQLRGAGLDLRNTS